jgi:putative ABC transport system permease protein
MSFLDLVRYAARSLTGHRLRSALSLVGVAIGVCAVVLLTALGEGARRYVIEQFASLGTNLLIVIPGKVETTGMIPGIGGGAPEDLTLSDARALERGVRGLTAIAPIATGEDLVSRGERSRRVPVLGSVASFRELRGIRMAEGRFLPEDDFERSRPVVVLGRKVADELFPTGGALGAAVRVGDFRTRVIGVMSSRGVHLGMDLDDAVIVPVASAMKMFDRSSLFRIIVQVNAHADLDATEERIIEILRDRHDDEDVTVLTQDAVVSSLTSILGTLTAALVGIGAVSLTVAGIGIMNVMLVTVSERTFEIGLLAAIGAKRLQILSIFLVESIVLALAGGAIGVGLAMIGVEGVRRAVPDFPAAAPGWAIAMALAVSVVVGSIFGWLPAAKASRLDPVAALAGGA